MKYKIIFANIILVLAMFPYIAFFNVPFEIQPWALITASIFSIFLLYEDKFIIPNPLKILALFTFYAFLTFFFLLIKNNANIITGVRSLAGYASVLVFAFVGYKTFSYIKTDYYIKSVGIWLLAAISQFIFGLTIFSIFLTRVSSGGSRGLTALATEPAFYSALCVSLLILNEFFYLNKKYGTKMYVGLFLILLLQIIFSYSGVGMMLLILFAVSKIFELIFLGGDKKRKLLVFGSIVLIFLSVIIFFNNKLLGEKRAGSVLKQSITNPIALVNNDYSVSNRLMNPIVGVYGGIVEARGLGFGVGSKDKDLAPEWISKLKGIQTRFGGKIEGGLVQIIYELGFVGIIYILTIVWIVLISILKNKKMRPALVTSAVSLFIPMCIFGSLSVPLFGYILGIHLYYYFYKE